MDAKRTPTAVLLAIVPSIALGLTNGIYGYDLAEYHGAVYWLADAVQFVLVPSACLLLLYRLAGYKPADYGFRSIAPDFGTAVALILFVTSMYWLAYEPVKALASAHWPKTIAPPVFAAVLPSEQPQRTVVLLYVCASAALVEETVFRGLPWLYFSSVMKSPAVPYVATTAISIAAIHWEHGVPNLVASGALGLVAAGLYTRVQNVWPFIWAHFFAGTWSYQWWV
jgi:membrane protease YdiL (CAAX protease family)